MNGRTIIDHDCRVNYFAGLAPGAHLNASGDSGVGFPGCDGKAARNPTVSATSVRAGNRPNDKLASGGVAGSLVPFTIRNTCFKKPAMMKSANPGRALSLQSQAGALLRGGEGCQGRESYFPGGRTVEIPFVIGKTPITADRIENGCSLKPCSFLK